MDDDFIPLDLSSDEEDNQQTVDTYETEETPPWVPQDFVYDDQDYTINLANEILHLCSHLSPSQKDHEAREELIQRISDICTDLDGELHVFGSFSTNLYLPTSDIDLMVEHTQGQKFMDLLAGELKKSGFVRNLEIIRNARVPIVKFEDRHSGIAVDICFNNFHGVESLEFVKTILEKYPAFRPLVMCLKFYLHLRMLNQPFYGGVGSFLLQMMVYSHLQMYPKRCHAFENEGEFFSKMNLGMLLISFFDVYGREFNYAVNGITVLDGGNYYNKWRKKGFFNGVHSYHLSFVNPINQKMDIGGAAAAIMKVRKSFSWALGELTVVESEPETNTMLQRILPYKNLEIFARKQYNIKYVPPRWETRNFTKRSKRHRSNDFHKKEGQEGRDDGSSHRRKRARRTKDVEDEIRIVGNPRNIARLRR